MVLRVAPQVQQYAEKLAKERDKAVQRTVTAEASTRTLHGNVAELEQRLLVRDNASHGSTLLQWTTNQSLPDSRACKLLKINELFTSRR